MATEAQWFYAHGGRQTGPISAAELKELIARGQVGPADLVWHEGMPAWTPAGHAAELIQAGPSGGAPPAPPIPVGYYTSTLGFPPRAAANLRGHAPPRGDIGDWPLDDVRINHFEETVKLRRKISAAASLYKSLLALTAISLAVLLPMAFFTVFSPGGSARAMRMASWPACAIALAFALLYFFAYRATQKSRRWAPLTMVIIFVCSGLWQIGSFAFTAVGPGSAMRGGPPAEAVLVILMIFEVAFAYMSLRAVTAIPQYLARPAWCQELIVKAGL